MGWFRGEIPANLRRYPQDDAEYYLYETARVSGRTRIGRFTYVGEHSVIAARSPVEIGSFCSIAANFTCVTNERPVAEFACAFPMGDVLGVFGFRGSEVGIANPPALNDRPVRIGHDVWIGDNVTVTGGATIGDGCVIGAKSVVEGECVPYGVYVGNPARLIRMRFAQERIEELQALRWWDWPVERILANARFFETDLTTYEGRIIDLIDAP